MVVLEFSLMLLLMLSTVLLMLLLEEVELEAEEVEVLEEVIVEVYLSLDRFLTICG